MPLGVAGEARYRLAPLAVPGLDDGRLPDGLNEARPAGSDAIALFADRARRVDPHFALSAQTVPLAIELAAAQLEALGMEQLLDRLGDSPGLLAGADRLAAARHRSLTAAMAWSYELLGAEEQRAFRAQAAFPGPGGSAGGAW